MHRTTINKIIDNGSSSDMLKLKDIFVDLVDYVKVYDKYKYKQAELELYKLAYGHHVSEDLAKTWVDSMENKDGTKGAHWTMQDASKFANGYDANDFYVAMNMAYSDYYSPSFDTNTYVTLAKDILSDKDTDDCKLLKYYFYVVKE